MSLTELYLGATDENEGRAEQKYHVRLPIFDGPMDLLLHLIRTNEVDIYDIPISEITEQYLSTLELLEELNLGLAGDFLLMAATLIHIKSKMLLPPPHEDGTEDGEPEDPRAELVARLLEYRSYKEAAQQLHQQELVRNAMWMRPESLVESLVPDPPPPDAMMDVDLFELLTAFRDVVQRVQRRGDLHIQERMVSVEEVIRRIRARIEPGTTLQFVDLFDDVFDRRMLIVTFLATLEMVRMRLIRIYQQKTFGAIHVTRLEDPAELPLEPEEPVT